MLHEKSKKEQDNSTRASVKKEMGMPRMAKSARIELLTKREGMKLAVEGVARELLFGSHLFPAVRNAYQRVFDREKLASRKQRLDFYAEFMSRGDLVFDVGANVGEYSDNFLALGARVVAIEPNAACCKRLKLLTKRGNLVIENCAIGDAEGTASMHICSDTGLSTLSNEWYQISRTSAIHSRSSWSGTVDVRVATLDSLVAKYGIPTFIKIDVEGFEDRVLAGMSFQPQALSFEFHFALLNLVGTCLRNAALQQAYSFNYTVGMNLSFELATWVGASDLERILAQAHSEEEFGDIFCRRA
jgi:FkbM family methyltransferase